MYLVYKIGTAKFYPQLGYDRKTSFKVLMEIFDCLPITITVIGMDRDPIIGWHWNMIYNTANASKVFYKTSKANPHKDRRIFMKSSDLYPKGPYDQFADTDQWTYWIQYIEKRQRQELIRQWLWKTAALFIAHCPHKHITDSAFYKYGHGETTNKNTLITF